MKKLLYVFLLFALCVVGCSRKVDSRLVLADSLVENRPDSAYVILRSVNPDSLSGGENRALYSLLMSQAMYKCNVRAKNDSLINIAVDYYKSTDNRANYARSLLFKGAVLYEMGDKKEALRFYKQAESVADTSNYDFIGYVNLRMAEVYTYSYIQNQEHIPKFRKALSNYKKSGNTKYQLSCLSGLSSCFRVHNMDSAYYYMDVMANLARTVGDSVKLYMALATKARAYESENKDREAIAIGRPVSRFQEKIPLVANVNYDLCRAYAKIGNLDSSLYFFRKLPTENLSDRERVFRLVAETQIALAQKDYKKAYQCKDYSSKLADSIIDRARQMELFETEKRFDRQQLLLQTVSLKREKTFAYFITAVIAIILLLGWICWLKRKAKLREQQLLIEQLQTVVSTSQNIINDKSQDAMMLQGILSQVIDNIRYFIDLSYRYNQQPGIFFNKFKERIKKTRLPDDFWKDFQYFVNSKYGNILSRLKKRCPDLSDDELHIVGLMCCGYSYIEIAICMGYTNPNYVSTKKLRISKKLGISEPLKGFIAHFVDNAESSSPEK